MEGVTIPVKRAILIAGPTASGKSAVAASVAEQLGGVVINADSMQVYRDLRVLTARPTANEEARVPHRLFGHVDAATAYSVGAWLAEMRDILSQAERDGHVPVLVGGTGLYIKALTQGLSSMPPIPPDLRERLRAEASAVRPEELHARLAARDPAMASRLRPSDPQRVLRALEVFEATGLSLSDFQQNRDPPLLRETEIAGVFLDPPRPVLYARIDARFDLMMQSGALDEVERLAERHLDPSLPAMRALGVPDLMRAIKGSEPLTAAIESGKKATRHYSRRQLTFARHQLPWITWVAPEAAPSTIQAAWEAVSESRGDGV